VDVPSKPATAERFYPIRPIFMTANDIGTSLIG